VPSVIVLTVRDTLDDSSASCWRTLPRPHAALVQILRCPSSSSLRKGVIVPDFGASPSGAARVLVMVEHSLVANVIELTLNHGVYVTRKARSLAEATAVLSEWVPHLAVIDMDIGGDTLVQHLERRSESSGTRIPTIALTRRGDLKTKLAAFAQGVDDIMTIPFAPEELLARVLALTRRTYGQPVTFNSILKVGEIEIDILQRHVRAGSSEIHLTGLEQSLLYLLVAHAGQVVTRDEIIDTLWGTDYVSESNIVDRHIRNLRAKLQNDWRKPRFIETVPEQGYRFIPMFSDGEPATFDESRPSHQPSR
jgi:DNA-binding response OmpR family regulator